MNLSKPIGGYFELELRNGDFPHTDSRLLNSGRACFEYVLRTKKPTHVYMPKFTCDVMFEPLNKLKIPYSLYELNEALELESSVDLKDGEYLVYTNYFGIKDTYSRQLSQKYEDKLILDCSQAFFFEPLPTGHTFYSPRKFFGLPDGGCLYSDAELDEELPIDMSYNRFMHLIKRIDEGAEAGYEDFKKDDKDLEGQPIKQMSNLTKALLGNIDFEAAKKVRSENFALLHESLKASNKLTINQDSISVAMCYPYLTDNTDLRQKLIAQKIFVATYWPNVLESCSDDELEYKLTTNILPLPLDQRYGADEMKRILEVMHG